VKEALTVERNLRARAEIKEEQMRQEIIATTGQMHAMRDKFTTDIQDEKEVVDNRTEELDLKVRAFRCAWVLVCVCVGFVLLTVCMSQVLVAACLLPSFYMV